MKRRAFITLLGGAAAAWPLAARAQRPQKVPTIGFLGPNTSSLDSRRVGAFVQRLRELGWIEGRNLAIMANAGASPAVLEMAEVQTTARALGLEVVASEIRRPEDIAPAFESFKGRAEALYVCNDPLVTTNRIRINTLALGMGLPTMY